MKLYDTYGKLQVSGGGSVDKLDDIGDVDVPTPADDDFFYYDDATGLWKSKAHSNLTTGVHGVGANYLAYTKGSQKEALFHNDYQARVYLGSDQLNIPDAVTTLVNLDTEEYDTNNDFNVTTHRYVAPISGYYLVVGSVTWLAASVVANKRFGTYILKNGEYYRSLNAHSAMIAAIGVNVTDICHLTAADYLELYAYHACGVDTVDIWGAIDTTFISICLLQAD